MTALYCNNLLTITPTYIA